MVTIKNVNEIVYILFFTLRIQIYVRFKFIAHFNLNAKLSTVKVRCTPSKTIVVFNRITSVYTLNFKLI